MSPVKHDDEHCACLKKIPFHSKKAAKESIQQIGRRADVSRMNAYLCPFCKQYHIGNKPRKRRS